MMSRQLMISLSLAIVTVLCPMTLAQDVVFHVDDDAVPLGDGLNWSTPFADLQIALAEAEAQPPGTLTQIKLAQGTYTPTGPNGDRSISFVLLNDVIIEGGYGGISEPDPDVRDVDLYQSILSGDLNGDDISGGSNGENAFHVLFAEDVDLSTVVDGVTITAGNASGGPADFSGGGLLAIGANNYPQFRSCRFIGNAANSTGGAVFIEDSVDLPCGEGCNPIAFIDCEFLDNAVTPFGGGSERGGAVELLDASGLFSNCVLSGNSALFRGGAVMCLGVETPRTTRFTNCLFCSNDTVGQGGAIYVAGQNYEVHVTNCTIANNVAVSAAGGVAVESNLAPAVVFVARNTILWGNTDAGPSDETSQLSDAIGGFPPPLQLVVNNSCIQDEAGGDGDIPYGGASAGNIDTDPMFCGPPVLDFRLCAQSSCTNRGDNSAISLDAEDVDGDGDLTEPTPDLDFADRIINGVIDLGCYELQTCQGDLDGDGAVDGTDLGLLLGNWGNPGAGDLNGDGTVNGADLGLLLAAWGACGAAAQQSGVTLTDALLAMGWESADEFRFWSMAAPPELRDTYAEVLHILLTE